MRWGTVWILAAGLLLGAGAGACSSEANGAGDAAPLHDASARDIPEDLAVEEFSTGLKDVGDAGATSDASDAGASKDGGDAGELAPCPPPTSDDDGSIIPPPRPCDASTPPPPPPP